jgi:predicted PurR-regulated permease PerM
VSSVPFDTSVLYEGVPDDSRTLGAGAGDEPLLHLRITPRAVGFVFAGAVVGLAAAHVLASARSVIALFTAAAVGALLIDPPVEFFGRYMRRWLAVLMTLLIVAVAYSAIVYGVFGDVDHELSRLQRDAPVAAARIERSGRFSESARKFHLQRRVDEAIRNLRTRTTKGRAQKTARRFGTYFVGIVLVIFLLSWGPRYLSGGLDQIDDAHRRRRMQTVVLASLRTTQQYLLVALAQAAIFGVASFAVFWLIDLPAPIVLALLMALGSLLPYVGLVIGGIPALLLAVGLSTGPRAYIALATIVALQLVQIFVIQPRVTKRVLYAGPALIAVVFLVGYDLYGLGGGLYGWALAIFALSVSDALGTEPVYAPSGAVADA